MTNNTDSSATVSTRSYEIPKHNNWVELDGKYLVDFDAVIQADRTAQKQRLLEALPEKYNPEYEMHIDGYQYGFNEAIDQFKAIVEGEV